MKFTDQRLSGIFGIKNYLTTKEDKIQNEIWNYVEEREAELMMNPLDWWRINEKKYQNLSRLAKLILCVPATSVQSERIFSKAGFIVNSLRASLSSDLVDKLIFLSHNMENL